MGGQLGAEQRENGGGGDAAGSERTHGIKTRPNNGKMKQATRRRTEKEVNESHVRREESEQRREGKRAEQM